MKVYNKCIISAHDRVYYLPFDYLNHIPNC